MPDYITVCEKASRAGGDLLLEKIGKVQAVEKAPADLVTEADIASQKTVSKIILDAFPNHSILGEENLAEMTRNSGTDYRWIIDPLDGTTNFVHQVPHYCVSIALEHCKDIVAATVYNPTNNECFTAEVGSGAFLNGQKIRVSSVASVNESLCAVGFPPGVRDDSSDLRAFLRTLPECQALRRTGSTALNLCYVAAGRFDAAWSFANKIWDMAAGYLLVKEAGGIISEPNGMGNCLRTCHFLAAATKELHAKLSNLIADAD